MGRGVERCGCCGAADQWVMRVTSDAEIAGGRGVAYAEEEVSGNG